jgi:hypothetical protein
MYLTPCDIEKKMMLFGERGNERPTCQSAYFISLPQSLLRLILPMVLKRPSIIGRPSGEAHEKYRRIPGPNAAVMLPTPPTHTPGVGTQSVGEYIGGLGGGIGIQSAQECVLTPVPSDEDEDDDIY